MKICFFCHVERKEILDIVEFYKQDINILKRLDPDLKIAIRFVDIDWSADIIFVWWWSYAFFPVIMGKLLRKKVIITGTFNYRCPEADNDFYRRPFWQRFLIKHSMKYATENILVSENEYTQIVTDWKYKNLVYSPHCVDIEKYIPDFSNSDKKFLFTICWTGKENVKRKCLYEIIDSIAIIKKKYRNINLYIAGHQGDAFHDIQEYINKFKLDSTITLLGKISEEDKIRYLQNCSCYLQPSKYEGFGLAIAEAMSCGAPVISTFVGEVPNVVGDAGILLENASPENIATAIMNVLDSDLTVYKNKARNRVATFFPMKRREKELISIVNKCKK